MNSDPNFQNAGMQNSGFGTPAPGEAPAPASSDAPAPQMQEPPATRPLAHPLHTLILVALILLNSWYGGVKHPVHRVAHGQVATYVSTGALELVIVGYIWLGLRLRRIPFREVLGRGWKSFDDFMLDIGVAILIWVAALVAIGILKKLMGMLSQQGINDQLDKLKVLTPHSVTDLLFFVLLAIMAGICEEIVFRGYLQKQFSAWFRNLPVGIIVSALLFGAAHGYQGLKSMLLLTVFGVALSVMTVIRKSLIPAMMAHASQDSLSGIALWFFSRHPELFKLG